MSTQALHAPLDATYAGPASIYIRETREELLSYETDELATLRFSIILTARWESSECESPERRAELRADLVLLRKHYEDKVDEIAMTWGVEQAMKAKAEVERTVSVPREVKPLSPTSIENDLGEEEFGAGGCEL
jgi:hypothetical protein